MASVNLEVTEKELRELVLTYIRNQLGDLPVSADDVKIMVKTRQNYRAEWETGQFKATITKTF
jgi:hypothetical protein